MKVFTDVQLDIIAHTLGINYYDAVNSKKEKDKHLPDNFYRNYYCACGVGGKPEPELLELMKLGYMGNYEKFSNLIFYTTDKGIEEFRTRFTKEVTNKWVPLSRSKQRYQEYREVSDCFDSFAQYLGIKSKTNNNI